MLSFGFLLPIFVLTSRRAMLMCEDQNAQRPFWHLKPHKLCFPGIASETLLVVSISAGESFVD